MFGPNSHLRYSASVDGSHRDPSAIQCIRNVKSKFSEIFGLEDYDIMFVPGSGTAGVESVIASSKLKLHAVGVEGVFRDRWERTINKYQTSEFKSVDEVSLYCQLETSCSTFQNIYGGIVDAVSSFPYFDLPKDSPAFITSTNKLLGSLAGLAIVGVRASEWDRLFQVEEESYLSLARYKRFIEANQTPTTVGTYLFDHLLEVLEGFDLDRQREKIERVSKLLCSGIGEEFVIGDSVGPVITVNANSIPLSLANKWNLYTKTNLGGVYQIFTYSCEELLYEEFITELKLERHV